MPQKELKFIHITKTAGMQIADSGMDAGVRWSHRHKEYGWWHEIFSRKSPEIRSKYDWFTVSRDPVSRIISEYHCVHTGLWLKGFKHNAVQFNEYLIRRILNRSLTGNHFTEQWRYIEPGVSVLKFENLQLDFQHLMKEYGLGVKLRPKPPARDRVFRKSDMSRELLALIEQVYAKDFEVHANSGVSRCCQATESSSLVKS